MKKSELKQLIKEELENSLNKRNIYQELSDIVHDNEGNLGDITDAVYEWVNQNFTIKNLSESQKLNVQQEMKSLMSDILESNEKVKQLMKQKLYIIK